MVVATQSKNVVAYFTKMVAGIKTSGCEVVFPHAQPKFLRIHATGLIGSPFHELASQTLAFGGIKHIKALQLNCPKATIFRLG